MQAGSPVEDVTSRSGSWRRSGDRWLLEIDGAVHEGHVLVRPHDVLVSHHGQRYTFTPTRTPSGPASRA